MDTKIEVLERVPLFAGCSKRELASVAALADEVDVPAGHALTVEGANAREFVIILSGGAAVAEGGEVVATLGDGDFLGEIALLTRTRRTATVTTTEPSRLLVLTDRGFRDLTERLPELASRLWSAASARLH